MKTIYLIENQKDSPGRIYAAFTSEKEAEKYRAKAQNGPDCGWYTISLYASAGEALRGQIDGT